MRRMQSAGLTGDKYTARTSGLARLGDAQGQKLGARYRTQREYDEKQEAGNAGSHLCGHGLVPAAASQRESLYVTEAALRKPQPCRPLRQLVAPQLSLFAGVGGWVLG